MTVSIFYEKVYKINDLGWADIIGIICGWQWNLGKCVLGSWNIDRRYNNRWKSMNRLYYINVVFMWFKVIANLCGQNCSILYRSFLYRHFVVLCWVSVSNIVLLRNIYTWGTQIQFWCECTNYPGILGHHVI